MSEHFMTFLNSMKTNSEHFSGVRIRFRFLYFPFSMYGMFIWHPVRFLLSLFYISSPLFMSRVCEDMNFKEIFSAPNLLSIFRILLIPFIAYTYLTATEYTDYLISGVLILISALSDTADGFLARRYNLVTDLGKMLDPVADKLTQIVLAVCVAVKIPGTAILLVIFILMEAIMILGGLFLLKRGVRIPGAMWFGKLATLVFYAVMIVMVFWPSPSSLFVSICVAVVLFFMLFSFIMYIPVFIKLLSGEKIPVPKFGE